VSCCSVVSPTLSVCVLGVSAAGGVSGFDTSFAPSIVHRMSASAEEEHAPARSGSSRGRCPRR